MTDNEIIKALERCIDNTKDCSECVFLGTEIKEFTTCHVKMIKNALDLINRQKGENSRLMLKIKEFDEKIVIQSGLIDRQKAEIKSLKLSCDRQTALIRKTDVNCRIAINIIGAYESRIKTTRAEAISEFAERLKKELSFGKYIQLDKIDNLVKEMAGEGG